MSEVSLLYFLLGFAFLVILAPPLHQYIRSKTRDLFEPIYAATFVFFIMFWVRSVYVLIWGSGVMGEAPFPDDLIRSWNFAWLYLVLATVMFFISYYSGIGVAIANALPLLPAEWSRGRVPLCILCLLGVGLTALFFLLRQFENTGGFFFNKATVITTLGTGPLVLLCYCTSVAVFIAYIVVLAGRRGGNLLLFVPLLLVALAAQAAQGMKGALIIFLLSFLIIRHYLKKQIRLGHALLFFLVAIWLVFPGITALRQARNLSQFQQLASKYYSAPGKTLDVAIQRFSGIDGLVYIIRDTPRVMDYQFGKTYLPVFYAWIPRQLWPDKPILGFGQIFTPIYLGHVFAPGGTTYGPTIFGEAYVNFNVAGILLASGLGGIFLRAFYHYLIKRKLGLSGVLVYSTTLPFVMVALEAHGVVWLSIGAVFAVAATSSLLLAKH